MITEKKVFSKIRGWFFSDIQLSLKKIVKSNNFISFLDNFVHVNKVCQARTFTKLLKQGEETGFLPILSTNLKKF